VSADHSTSALDVAGLTCRFGQRRALDDCSFTVPAGAVAALVGRNGAGKSTLLRAAAGLLRPNGGAVRVFGKPAGDDTVLRIGYVGQQAPLYPMLTVAQTLAWAAGSMHAGTPRTLAGSLTRRSCRTVRGWARSPRGSAPVSRW
jgi:ABC-2 type transport system ATP-binding protein